MIKSDLSVYLICIIIIYFLLISSLVIRGSKIKPFSLLEIFINTPLINEESRFQDIMNFLINLEKTDQNFNPTEIYGKSMSLVGVMEPFTHNGNLQLLKKAGFKDIDVIFKYLNFQGYLCIK